MAIERVGILVAIAVAVAIASKSLNGELFGYHPAFLTIGACP